MGSTASPWKQLLLNALQSNSHLRHSSYFQLATIGPNGMPANRTVVFRGFQDSSNKIQINTDTRTHKIEDLNHWPFAEICWYFTDSWEQFRINGPVDVIDGSNPDSMKLQQREKAWFASSPKSRLQYLGPNPGLPSFGDQPDEGPSSLDPAAGPVAAFCLLVLDPHQVDYLNLKSSERVSFSRKIANEDVSWNSEKVNP
ncbi:pyridoxine/pyridoxamine 5'-phosphate oxidase 2-like isoform X1 [Bidens hawaiensis]|uniref:pyridoxine/pyridoxamine 5'-phosphate oxidase 2-like isoform X1 n=1 Tax=Bidens hawaiensis TaxID=980011 RepID=UPI0040491C2F